MKITIEVPDNKYDSEICDEMEWWAEKMSATSMKIEHLEISDEDEEKLREVEAELSYKHNFTLDIDGEKFEDWEKRRNEEMKEAYQEWHDKERTYDALDKMFLIRTR